MIKDLFKLDLRSLAFARICLGILAVYDLMRRLPDLHDFFTDDGLMPRWVLLEQFQHNWKMSLLYLNGSYSWALMIAVAGLVAAVAFTIGWKTRTSNAVLWLVIVSFQQRFPEAATSGGDMLFRIFLFYSFFLPMNARYSIDGAVSEINQKENEYFSIFTTTWIAQIILLYTMTFLYKWAPVYHTTFEAVWYMLQLDLFTTDFGRWLGQHYMATKVLSFASYALEIIGPLLLIIPFRKDFFRSVAVISFWLFHLGIGATMHLGNFVPICLIIWCGLIPTAWWDYLAEKYKTTQAAAQHLFYDAQSEFAYKLGLMAKNLLFLNVELAKAPQGLLEEGRRYALETNDAGILSGRGLLPKLLLTSRLSLFRMIGKFFTSEIGMYLSEVKEAGEVSMFGDQAISSPKSSGPNKTYETIKSLFEIVGFGSINIKLNRLEKSLGAFLLLLIIGWNIEGYVEDRKWYIGSPFDEIMFATQLNQGWAMFAPHPQRSDGWWVMEGELSDGTKWDALNNKEVSFERPDSMYATYASDDWMKFLDNLSGSRDDKQLLLLGKHLCRKWNGQNFGNRALQTFRLHFMQEWTNPPQEPRSEVNKITLWNHSCF